MRNPATAKPNAEREKIYREVLKELREIKSKLISAPKITRNGATAAWAVKKAIRYLEKELLTYSAIHEV